MQTYTGLCGEISFKHGCKAKFGSEKIFVVKLASNIFLWWKLRSDLYCVEICSHHHFEVESHFERFCNRTCMKMMSFRWESKSA